VGLSVIVGGISSTDASRNTALKGMIKQNHRTRKEKRRRNQWVQCLCLSLCAQHVDSHDILYTDIWIRKKEWQLRHRSSSDWCQTGYCSRTARETAIHEMRPTGFIDRDTSHFKLSFRETDSVMTLTENLGCSLPVSLTKTTEIVGSGVFCWVHGKLGNKPVCTERVWKQAGHF
jgi:hypothetical protein